MINGTDYGNSNTQEVPVEIVEIGGRKAIQRCCPLCGEAASSARQSKYSDSIWTVKECLSCDFVYLENAPIYDELASVYSWDKTSVDRHEERKRKHPFLYRLSKSTRWRLHLFKRKRVEDILLQYVLDGNVLDIGCGKGDQLKKLPASYVPFGIEISEVEASYAVDFAQSRGGKIVVSSAIDGLREFPDDFAGSIIMRSFLEHEADPKGVLEQTCRVLRLSGIAIIKVPNFGCINRAVLGKNWSGFRFPDHLNYFTPRTLRAMCEKTGLSIRRFGIMDRFPLSDNMWLIASKG